MNATKLNNAQVPNSIESKWQKEERNRKRFLRYVFLPIFILGLPFILAYAMHLKDYLQTVILENTETYRELVEQRRQDYTATLLGEAYTHLHRNEADHAQRMFNYILLENKYNYWANYGMAQTLIMQCKDKNMYCDLAREYCVFTQKLNDKHHEELNVALLNLE